MNKICFGCGVKLQSHSKDNPGYVPESKLEDSAYCMRCFRMIHYGESNVTNTPKEAKEIVNKINKDNRFVIFLVDFLNINDEVIKIFKSIKKEKMLVVNKCELMPKHIKRERVREYLKTHYDIKDTIKLKGGTNTHGVKSILAYLEDEGITEAYIVGMSNSGKSTLINDLINLENSSVVKTTVNNKANTTVDFIRVKINDNLTLIDSPGVILSHSLNHDSSGKNIVAYSMNMKECETVSLLDNAYFLKFDSKTPIVFYTNQVSKKAIKKYFKAAPNLVNAIDIDEDYVDIVIYGIGFVTVKKKCTVTTNIDASFIEVRPSIFKSVVCEIGGQDE